MKLNNTQKNIIIFFSTIISIFFASFIWDKITIPFSNPSGANGLLVVQKYNPINDTLRYIFFISLPLIVFFYLNLSLKRKKFNLINLFFEREQKVFNNPHVVNILFFIFIIFLILEFLSLGFFPNVPFDHFHDGTFLSPAQNYIANKKIWTGSYLTHGGSDILYPILMWKLLGVESIGSFRTYSIILVLILIVKHHLKN